MFSVIVVLDLLNIIIETLFTLFGPSDNPSQLAAFIWLVDVYFPLHLIVLLQLLESFKQEIFSTDASAAASKRSFSAAAAAADLSATRHMVGSTDVGASIAPDFVAENPSLHGTGAAGDVKS